MGTIVPRRRKDGSTAFMAQIRLARDGQIFRETKTFERKQAAAAWLEKREAELSVPGGVERARAGDPTLADVIETYISSAKSFGRTKAQVLRSIKSYPLAEMRCSKIGSPDIIAFANQLSAGRQPQTVQNYLSHLGAIFAIARPAWGFPLDQQAMRDAFTVAKRLELTSKSTKRDRRPTVAEVGRLVAYFAERGRRRPDAAPMPAIIAFALFSTRRQEEITRITWADLDVDGKCVVVRDMKHPGQKIGNDIRCDLPQPALDVIATMPRVDARIFPYDAGSISAAFTRACKVLGIDDLHFHDLRHEGVSRLFEMGMTIPHVAAVSGHRSWESLKRYTHLRQSGDKWATLAALCS